MFQVGDLIRYRRDQQIFYGIFVRELRSINSIALFIPNSPYPEVIVHCDNVLGVVEDLDAPRGLA